MTHDSVLMLPFSCSHRPGVCTTRPNCKARSDGGEGRGKGPLDEWPTRPFPLNPPLYGGQGGQPLRMAGWAN